MSGTVLVVDDEADLVGLLEYNLQKEGYRTRTARSGADALLLARQNPPDLVVLDLMLPDISGIEVCRRLRTEERTRRVPVIMLTARGEEIDRVVGFEVGADDYVTKPFSVRELLLRVRAVLRRGVEDEDSAKRIAVGPIDVDPERHEVSIDGAKVALTSLEFKLLHTFVQRRGRVQTREQLLSDVWGVSPELTTRTVDTHVKRLRDKLGSAADLLETVRGVGYRLKDPADTSTVA